MTDSIITLHSNIADALQPSLHVYPAPDNTVYGFLIFQNQFELDLGQHPSIAALKSAAYRMRDALENHLQHAVRHLSGDQLQDIRQIPAMHHDSSCQHALDEANTARREWIASHPNHCRHCQGNGGFYSRYDPSPGGLSLGAGSLTDFDICPLCVGLDLCPWCRQRLSGDLLSCQCGWIAEQPGIDTTAECTCSPLE